jgi:putative phosphoesterase
MKIMILSDIHGNLPALTTVLEKERIVDAVLFLGDVVDYGPQPKECMTFLRGQKNVFAVRGNHDNALALGADCNCMGTFREYSLATRAWHATLLDEADKRFLLSMPLMQLIELDGDALWLAHASPTGNLSRYMNGEEIEEEATLLQCDYVFVGHTHIQYRKSCGNKTVVNPGSVGLARDTPGNACYAVLEDGLLRLERIPYDVEQTVALLSAAPIGDAVITGLARALRGA